MNTRIIAIATALVVVGLALPTAAVALEIAPSLGNLSPVGEAQAARCIIGYHYDCIIQIVCIRECGPPTP